MTNSFGVMHGRLSPGKVSKRTSHKPQEAQHASTTIAFDNNTPTDIKIFNTASCPSLSSEREQASGVLWCASGKHFIYLAGRSYRQTLANIWFHEGIRPRALYVADNGVIMTRRCQSATKATSHMAFLQLTFAVLAFCLVMVGNTGGVRTALAGHSTKQSEGKPKADLLQLSRPVALDLMNDAFSNHECREDLQKADRDRIDFMVAERNQIKEALGRQYGAESLSRQTVGLNPVDIQSSYDASDESSNLRLNEGD